MTQIIHKTTSLALIEIVVEISVGNTEYTVEVYRGLKKALNTLSMAYY